MEIFIKIYCPGCGECGAARLLATDYIFPHPVDPSLQCCTCNIKIRLNFYLIDEAVDDKMLPKDVD